jgi:hypothetical protein
VKSSAGYVEWYKLVLASKSFAAINGKFIKLCPENSVSKVNAEKYNSTKE